jgi:hypothetical protein
MLDEPRFYQTQVISHGVYSPLICIAPSCVQVPQELQLVTSSVPRLPHIRHPTTRRPLRPSPPVHWSVWSRSPALHSVAGEPPNADTQLEARFKLHPGPLRAPVGAACSERDFSRVHAPEVIDQDLPVGVRTFLKVEEDEQVEDRVIIPSDSPR